PGREPGRCARHPGSKPRDGPGLSPDGATRLRGVGRNGHINSPLLPPFHSQWNAGSAWQDWGPEGRDLSPDPRESQAERRLLQLADADVAQGQLTLVVALDRDVTLLRAPVV